MNRILLAFRCFFNILFHGELAPPALAALGLSRRAAAAPAAAPAGRAAPVERAADGALQMLGILQRDSRLIDFLQEDIAGYADDQIGAARFRAMLELVYTGPPVVERPVEAWPDQDEEDSDD